VLGFIIFLITRESIFYINLRQAYLMNPAYAAKLSSRTVLFTAVPDEYLNEARLRDMLGPAVVRVWLPTDTSDLDDMVSDRLKIAMNLEGAETKLIREANGAHLKSLKKGEAATGDNQAAAAAAEGESGSAAARWITPKQRPTHRLKPIIGKKVDTINWCRGELASLIPKVEAEQEKHRNAEAKKLRAAFVEFTNLREAQAAYQSLTHHQVLTMAPRYTGMHPSDIIWSNLKIRGWERYIRFALVTSFVVALIVFWSIPVAVVGIISNVTYLTNKIHFLKFLLDIPTVIRGVVTGLLPTVMLALLMSLLPPILRLAARLGGSPTYSDVEYSLQNSYFGFQIVQVFLVATLSSAATSVATTILATPSKAPTILSTYLPTASNFYLSYFIVQGLGVFSGTLVGIAGLFVTPLLVRILGSTPRKIFMRWNQLTNVSWGVVYPIYTNLFVIGTLTVPVYNLPRSVLTVYSDLLCRNCTSRPRLRRHRSVPLLLRLPLQLPLRLRPRHRRERPQLPTSSAAPLRRPLHCGSLPLRSLRHSSC
jgi:calcium permeable stress-gated cation channel